MTNKAVVLVSGGMDSVTLAHLCAHEGWEGMTLSFDYGQRHRKELGYAVACASRLGWPHRVVSLQSITPILSGSALTDPDVPVPLGHYAAPTMAATVVPNRNAILLAIAYALAVSEEANIVALAVHAGDHFIYPDCRPEFVGAFSRMEKLATEGFGKPDLSLFAPFLYDSKADIVAQGARLGVPYAETWSCYQGGAFHCGLCGTCVERKEAFAAADVPDPTEYEA